MDQEAMALTKGHESRSDKMNGITARQQYEMYKPQYRIVSGTELLDEFEDLRDAILAAKSLRNSNPTAVISVMDLTSGHLVIDID